MKTFYAIMGFICLFFAVGLTFDPTIGEMIIVAVLLLAFAILMYKAGAYNITPHSVYFHKHGEAIKFLRSKGWTAENPYMEIAKKGYIIHDGWMVVMTTEQGALSHKNDTRPINHVLVNLGLKDE